MTPHTFLRVWVCAVQKIVQSHYAQVQKIAPGPNRPVVELLHTATALNRLEFYMNNVRTESRFTHEVLDMLLSCSFLVLQK
jgi:hypothetical protein